VRGLATYYTLFLIELQSRRVHVVGSTRHPDEAFIVQAMRHLTDEVAGVLGRGRVLICDRDQKWSRAALEFLSREGVRIVRTPNILTKCRRRWRTLLTICVGATTLYRRTHLPTSPNGGDASVTPQRIGVARSHVAGTRR